MEPFQPQMHYDDIDDALHDVVMFLGGFKKVGPMLWPPEPEGKTMDDAAQQLRHCLNKHRREKLSPHQTIFLLRKARDVGFHQAKHFLDDATGYQRSAPQDPADEMVDLQRRYIDSVAEQRRIAERMERLARSPMALVGKQGA